jgi:hypothetical protein
VYKASLEHVDFDHRPRDYKTVDLDYKIPEKDYKKTRFWATERLAGPSIKCGLC